MLSIIAGILIALGGVAYLQVGGPVGAVLFSIGLLTICYYKCELFTGKAGLLASRAIRPIKLVGIWCGNLIGCASMGLLLSLTHFGETIGQSAAAITLVRSSNMWYENIIFGVLCGLFMYIAVAHYDSKPWVTVMCVAGFILSGVNHCVADMFYLFLGGFTWTGALALTLTTVGNVIGCNLIPLLLSLHRLLLSHSTRPKTQSDRDSGH